MKKQKKNIIHIVNILANFVENLTSNSDKNIKKKKQLKTFYKRNKMRWCEVCNTGTGREKKTRRSRKSRKQEYLKQQQWIFLKIQYMIL